MKRTKHVLFTFSPYMYKGVEGYLNEQAALGWELVKVGPLGIAKFRRTQRADLKYCADLLTYLRGKEGQEEQREYLALCREGGWELVARRGSLGLFASLPGTDPAPIQTDPGAEWEHYKRAYWNSLLWVAWVIFCYVFAPVMRIFTAGGPSVAGEALVRTIRFEWLSDLIIAGWLAALPIFCGVALWKTGGFLRNWAYTRQTGAIQVPARWAMWANAVVNLIGLAAFLVVMAGYVAEIVQNGSPVATFVMFAIVGAAVFFWPNLTHVDQVYPLNYRQVRIYGAGLVLLGVLVTAATWGYEGNTVTFWKDGGEFEAYYAALEEEPVVREVDYGQQPEGSYELRQGIGPTGRYTILVNGAYREIVHPSCSRYDCYSGWLAELTMETLKQEAETPGKGVDELAGRLWTNWEYNASRLEQVELSWADEAWYGQWSTNGTDRAEAERGTVLVVRKGNTAVRICARVDLLEEEIQQAVRVRLGF